MSRTWLGTAAFGSWGNPDHATCTAIVRRAIDAGVNVIDTADSYSEGEAETIVGAALAGTSPDEVMVATKVGYRAGETVGSLGTRKDIVAAAEASLRRLQRETIDLYQLHRYDPAADLDEVLAALDDLVRSGKVRAVGTSTFRADQLVDAVHAARRVGAPPIATEQAPYSIFVREIERAVFETCRRHGVALVAHAPLNGGWLTGKYRSGEPVPSTSRAETWPIRRDRFDFARAATIRKLELVDRLDALASEAGLTLTALATAFPLQHPDVVGSIIGARTVEQLDPLLAAGKVVLSDDVLDAIDSIVAPGDTVDAADIAAYASDDLRDARRRRLHADGD